MKKLILGLIASIVFVCAHVQNAEEIVDNIIKLYQEHGHADYIGEKVSQTQHALQAAHEAEKQGAGDELIIAALLHDIGHLCAPEDALSMDGFGTHDHDKIGADYLSACGFSKNVVNLVAGHVAAKRYLAYKKPEYVPALSHASQQTLTFQGGAMSKEEAEQFEIDPLCMAKIMVRNCDNAAKDPDAKVPGFDYYREMLINHVKQQRVS